MTDLRLRSMIPAVIALSLCSCSGDRPRNVLLISIDTLRADRLSSYGFGKETTPNLDALAREGARFEHVLSPVPLTLPAHASLLTGNIPPVHGVHDNLSAGLGEDQTTLAELFQEAGFRTGAVVSSFVLDSRFNLSQGFESYDDEFEEEHRIGFLNERKGAETTRRALGWLEEHGSEKFFLFVHYYDPHDDYAPPPPFDHRFPDDPYAGEVAFVDQQVAEVLRKLDELGLSEDTLVVVTSDHGEMLEEHGEGTHGYFIYQSALRVPLILRGPGIEPRVVKQRIGLIDVAPTIAALMRLEFPKPTLGRDASGWIRGDAEPAGRRPLYAESVTPNRYYGLSSLFGVVVGRWKYIRTERPELYDLGSDPVETRNVVEDHPDVASGMESVLEELLGVEGSSGNEAVLDDEALRRLASLGYLSGGSGGGTRDIEPKGDPKDWIGFYRRHQRLEKLVDGKRYSEASELAETLVREKPDFTAGYLQLGLIALETSAPDEARAHFSKAVDLEPENGTAHFHLAEALARLGRNDTAVEHFHKVLALDPAHDGARKRLAQVLYEGGDVEGALAYLRDAVASSPRNVEARVQMGVALASRGAWEEAELELRKALELDPVHGEAHLQLGSVLTRKGELDEAVAHLRRALETMPKPVEAHRRLGLALREQGKTEEALEHFQKAITLDPQHALAQNHLGLALKDLGRLDEALSHYERAIALDPDLAEAHNNRGSLLASRGRIQDALRSFRRAVEADPGLAEAHNNLGLALRMTGDREGALEHFRAARIGRPDWPEPMTEIAWILATHPEAAGRNPGEALRLARRAAELTGHRQPVILDTLAAALAANGDFDQAVEQAQRAIDLAAAENSALAPEMRRRLDLYRERKPFREAPRTLAAPPSP